MSIGAGSASRVSCDRINDLELFSTLQYLYFSYHSSSLGAQAWNRNAKKSRVSCEPAHSRTSGAKTSSSLYLKSYNKRIKPGRSNRKRPAGYRVSVGCYFILATSSSCPEHRELRGSGIESYRGGQRTFVTVYVHVYNLYINKYTRYGLDSVERIRARRPT